MIRIYHLEGDNYTFSDHEATVFRRRGMWGQGAGYAPTNEFSIRIFTSELITVSRGDYVAPDGSSDPEPDRSNHLNITEVTDNRRGTRPHWRLVCGGNMYG